MANLFVLFLMLANVQSLTVKRVLEGFSTNIDILCDLDLELHPQYWEIQGGVYDLYSVPEIFEVRGYEAITLANVDRRMNGWRFRCFTIVNENNLNLGETTILEVVNGMNAATPPDDPNLLRSSLLGRLVLHYQKLQLGLESTTLSWLYTPHSSSPCNISGYRVNIYTQEEISVADTQRNLMPTATNFVTTEQNITVASHSLADYFRVSAVHSSSSICADAAFFNNFTVNTRDLHMNQRSSSFIIPEDIRKNIKSIQLIWSKDSNTQCVCPPVEELMPRCACNAENMNRNFITISNNTVIVSNITLDVDEKKLSLFFVFSTSSGCNYDCNLRSIQRVYRLFTIPGYPLPPLYSEQNTDTGLAICLHIPDNPISPEVYEVNLTDSTGSLTMLSGIYSTSQCLNITSDLYANACRPVQFSVAAINSVGSEVSQQTLLQDNQPTPCDCYRAKEKISLITTAFETFAVLTLICQLNVDADFTAILVITQTENSTITHNITATCNATVIVNSLTESTNYTVTTVHKSTSYPNPQIHKCSLDHFRTSQPAATATVATTAATTATTNVLLITGSILAFVMFIITLHIIGIIVVCCLVIRRRYFSFKIL